MSARLRRALRGSWRLILIAATLAYLFYMIKGDLPRLAQQIVPITGPRVAWLCLSIVLLGACPLFSIGVFRALAQRHSQEPIRYRQCLQLVLTSNLMRYLPGRFFGVAYQVSTPLPGLTGLGMLRVNVEQLLMAAVGNVIIALGILLVGRGYWLLGLSAVLGSLPASVGVLSLRVPRRPRAWLAARVPERLRPLFAEDVAGVRGGSAALWLATVLQSSSWLPYLLAWHLLSNVLPLLAGQPLVEIAASYSIGWAVGMLSIVTPSGLGVREAVFLLVGRSLAAPQALALIAILARPWQLAGDVAAWLFGLGLPALLGWSAQSKRVEGDH